MNKFEDFALRMSVLLFDMASDDIAMSTLSTDDDREVPESYVDKILDDKDHCTAIKEKIRLSVLESVQQFPTSFKQEKNPDTGELKYVYSSTVYCHAYMMDVYIVDQFITDNPIIEDRYICAVCGSDNVQVKAWVKPNENNEYIDQVEADDDCWCDDCQNHSTIKTVMMNVRRTVIGFQVDLDSNDEMHPDMSASFCVYSLPQVLNMIKSDNNRWKILTIYDDTIEEPTMMFNGDPRNPDETVLDVLLNK